MKYKITATLTTELEVEIDAPSYEEALRIAEYDLITDDFDIADRVFNLNEVREIK